MTLVPWALVVVGVGCSGAPRSGPGSGVGTLRVEHDGGHGLVTPRTQLVDEWADLFAFVLAHSEP